MKEVIYLSNNRAEFEALDPVAQRSAVVLREGFYGSDYIVISDLDGRGWYVGQYSSTPRLSSTGRIFWKSFCAISVTYKNGKFWGNLFALTLLVKHVKRFQFLLQSPNRVGVITGYRRWLKDGTVRMDPDGFIVSIPTLPKTVLSKILDGKITSQEALWKAISKVSYKDAHWKVVRFCRENHISMPYLKMACPNYEAILTNKTFAPYEDVDPRDMGELRTFSELIKYAVVLGEQVNANWSATRISEELTRMKRAMIGRKLLLKDATAVWKNIPDFGEFSLVNTERDALETSEVFNNCVYSCYWGKIKAHKYVAFTSKTLCVGYQIMPDGDVMFDQIHGPMNSYIDPQIRNATDAFLRPLVQQLIADNQGLIPDDYYYGEVDLPY